MKRYATFLGAVLFILFTFYPSVSFAQPEGREMDRKNNLNFTPEQKTKLEERRKARQEERQAFREQMRNLRADLREAMKDPQADEKKIDALIDEMTRLRATRLKSSLRQSREIRKIFTPEQLEKLEKFRAGITHSRGRRQGHFWNRGGWAPRWRRHLFRGRGYYGPGLRDRWGG